MSIIRLNPMFNLLDEFEDFGGMSKISNLMKNFVPSNLCADLYKCGHPKQLTKSSLCPLWSYEDKPFEFPVRCLADDGEFDNDETCEWLERLS